MKGNTATVIPAIIFTCNRRSKPPPIIDIEVEQTWNDDDETTDKTMTTFHPQQSDRDRCARKKETQHDSNSCHK